ncbi:DUF5695 domain-containing protein [Sphingomonas sp. I4]
MVASEAYAQTDWAKAGKPWNDPTSFTLAPGEHRTIGLRLVTAPSIRAIEPTLMAQKRPVVVGVPGYVVPTDLDATLFVHAPTAITGIASYPAGRWTYRDSRAGRAGADCRYAASNGAVPA